VATTADSQVVDFMAKRANSPMTNAQSFNSPSSKGFWPNHSEFSRTSDEKQVEFERNNFLLQNR
jgi:hypothetical protein